MIQGAAASLITKDGVFVFNRVYFSEGQFDLGDGKGRVGSTCQKVLSAAYDPDKGLRVHLTDYEVQVPPQCLSVSWKRPG